MGLGRREFLRLSGLALAGLAVNPLQAVVTNENVYVNKMLGILFYKPATWQFVKVKDFGQLKDAQLFADDWGELKEQVLADISDPICVMTKYPYEDPKYKGIFSPTITFHVMPVTELEETGCTDYAELRVASEEATGRLLKEFEVKKRHDPYKICGCPFYASDATYLFEHIEMVKPVRVELKVLEAEHNGFFYSINLHQSPEENEAAHREFAEFKKSIRLL